MLMATNLRTAVELPHILTKGFFADILDVMNEQRRRVLIVDDDDLALVFYSTVLEYHDIADLKMCQDSREVLPLLKSELFSVILIDLNMLYVSGQEVLRQIKEAYPEIPVIVITGEDKVDTAVECMKIGAFDYLTKPVNKNRLVSVVKHAMDMRQLQEEVHVLSKEVFSRELKHPEAFSEIITCSNMMKAIFRYAEVIAKSPKSVLITGESGTGKELIARALHRLSNRKGNFVPVNVAGLDDAMFSDTLFGHKKGAFTGADTQRNGLIEQAADGTLFLDEIGDLEIGSQIKLLRLLQEEEYYPIGSDVPKRAEAKLIAATNADLRLKQEQGSFRKDLYYRLLFHHIEIPPLRNRIEDIPLLVRHFIEESAKSLEKKAPTAPKELFTLLTTYHFPGNVRELQSMIFDAVSRHSSGVLSLSYFKDYLAAHKQDATSTEKNRATSVLFSEFGKFPSLKEVEDLLIEEAIKKTNGNQSIAAQLLGISQSTLSRRLREKNG